MSTTYQKIPGPFIRDNVTNLLTAEYTSADLAALENVQWNFTEKIDGTNVRIIWDGHRVTFAGRTDNAQFHPDLFTLLNQRFGGEDNETLFEQKFGDTPVVIYGEGFGPKIQSGGKYSDTIQFAIFDVMIGGMYLERRNVEDIAAYFTSPVVPLILTSNLREGIHRVSGGLASSYGPFLAEGLVGVTSTGLLNRRGERIIVKIKSRDFGLR